MGRPKTAFNPESILVYLAKYTAMANERGCTLWTGSKKGNAKYAYNFYPWANIDWKGYAAHRLQWEILKGPIPDGMKVCHHCDEPLCMNIEHHFLGTAKENTRDMIQKGRAKYGEKHPMRKLTDTQVLEVRARFNAGESQTAIAKSLGMGTSQIHRIVRNHGRNLDAN